MTEFETTYCDKCRAELEVGQVGLCGDCLKTYSIFNMQGECVEGQTFADVAQATAFMDATDWVTEYGPVHVGELCQTHDEGEKGNCPFCSRKPAHTQDSDCSVNECGYAIGITYRLTAALNTEAL